jgi:hypothetical protein
MVKQTHFNVIFIHTLPILYYLQDPMNIFCGEGMFSGSGAESYFIVAVVLCQK